MFNDLLSARLEDDNLWGNGAGTTSTRMIETQGREREWSWGGGGVGKRTDCLVGWLAVEA